MDELVSRSDKKEESKNLTFYKITNCVNHARANSSEYKFLLDSVVIFFC